MVEAAEARKDVMMVMSCAAWTTAPGVMSGAAAAGETRDPGDAS